MNLAAYLKQIMELTSIFEKLNSHNEHVRYFDTIDQDGNCTEVMVILDTNDIYFRLHGRDIWHFIGEVEELINI